MYEQYKDGSLHPVDRVGLTTDRLDHEGKTYKVGNASVTARLPSFRSPEVPLAPPSAQEPLLKLYLKLRILGMLGMLIKGTSMFALKMASNHDYTKTINVMLILK